MTPAALAALAKGDSENFITAATPGGIEAQEKRGQIEQSFKETLPKHGCDQKALEALGFKFTGEGHGQDSIFWECQFPKGWRKQPSEHSMWSNLLDDKGRKRGSIFFKAAFYDYDAHMSLSLRFSISRYSDNKTVEVKDGDKVIYSAGKYSDYAEMDILTPKAEAWLREHYPDWKNPNAYWD